jgi:Caspase domain
MRLYLLLASLIFSVGLCSRAQPLQDPRSNLAYSSNRFALLVGVEKYDDSNISPLDGPARDVHEMKEVLVKKAGFDPENVTVLTTSKDPLLRPTSPNVIKALEEMRTRIKKGDLFLFMFSGHGVEKDDKAVLLTQDAMNIGNIKVLERTSISLEYLNAAIQDTMATKVVVFLDACRNNPWSSKGQEPNLMSKAYRKAFSFDDANNAISISAVLYATSEGQRAWNDPKRKMGFFSEALVDGLNGKAVSSNGDVTLDGLLEYVKAEVPKAVQKDLPGTEPQNPFPVIKGYPKDLVLSHINVIDLPVQKASQDLSKDPDKLGDSRVLEFCRPSVSARRGQKLGMTAPEVCPPIQLNLLDTSYHQPAFSCCGGGAKQTMTLSDIPAGFELSIDASGSYSVSETKLLGDKFSLILFCAPPKSVWGAGCRNTVTVKAHYLLHPKVAPPASVVPPYPTAFAVEPVSQTLARQLSSITQILRQLPYSTTSQRNSLLGHGFRTECGTNFTPQCAARAQAINSQEQGAYLSHRPEVLQLRSKAIPLLQLTGQKLMEDDARFQAIDKAAVEPLPIPKDVNEAFNPPRKYLEVLNYLDNLTTQLNNLQK